MRLVLAVDGRRVKAAAQVTKQGFVFIGSRSAADHENSIDRRRRCSWVLEVGARLHRLHIQRRFESSRQREGARLPGTAADHEKRLVLVFFGNRSAADHEKRLVLVFFGNRSAADHEKRLVLVFFGNRSAADHEKRLVLVFFGNRSAADHEKRLVLVFFGNRSAADHEYGFLPLPDGDKRLVLAVDGRRRHAVDGNRSAADHEYGFLPLPDGEDGTPSWNTVHRHHALGDQDARLESSRTAADHEKVARLERASVLPVRSCWKFQGSLSVVWKESRP